MVAHADLDHCVQAVAAGALVPYLGPGVMALGTSAVPASPAALAGAIETQVRPPRRAAGNLWAVAQFVETRRFRRTLETIVGRAFDGDAGDNPIHRWLARIRPPLVVDTWYDDGLLRAYGESGSSDWGWVQGAGRHGARVEGWTRTHDAQGDARPEGPDPGWRSLIYKPHGLARTGSPFLMSDSDYVEVLTEIDIQTPIPDAVKARRHDRGFLFIGCRFDDQLLRMYARQIMKRSTGPRYAVVEGALTRMEARFFDEQSITRIDRDIQDVATAMPSERGTQEPMPAPAS